jgi:hypothetical protein
MGLIDNRDMAEKQHTLELFKEFLDNNEPFVFAKFGDGELLCMDGARGCNCDKHPYSKDLGDKLKKALFNISGKSNAYIADWNEPKFLKIRSKYTNPETADNLNLVDYQLILSLDQNFGDHLREFYRSIKKASETREVVMVIPEKLNGVADYIAPTGRIVNVPKINSFSKYDEVLSKITGDLKDNSIMITACGMMAKSLISEVITENPLTTCIDFGSAFDPLFIGHTRDGQAPAENVKAFFDSI